jgi:hypothetical protein
VVAPRGERDGRIESFGEVRILPVVDPQGKRDGVFSRNESIEYKRPVSGPVPVEIGQGKPGIVLGNSRRAGVKRHFKAVGSRCRMVCREPKEGAALPLQLVEDSRLFEIKVETVIFTAGRRKRSDQK